MEIIHLLPYDLRRFLFSIRHPKVFHKLQTERISISDRYSFKQFDETQTIFVHIPKAAGISVCMALYGNLAGGHTPISWYQYVFSKREFNNYFKFTFVRNPWDRLYSAYSFLKRGGYNEKDRMWYKNNISHFKSFEDFVLNWVNIDNILQYIHFVPQTNMLCFPGRKKIIVDFVGFFENIDQDFQYVAKKMNKKVSLQHLNKALKKQKTYQNVYNDAMIEVVDSVYKNDIKILGYTFNNSSLPKQLKLRLETVRF